MNEFWKDQMEAASASSGKMVQRIGDAMRVTGELKHSSWNKVTMAHIVIAERLAKEKALSCPHISKSKGPLSIIYIPNINRASCTRSECLTHIATFTEKADDNCDWCRQRPLDNVFHEVVLSLGPFTVFGHQCTHCNETLTAEPSEEVRKKYFYD